MTREVSRFRATRGDPTCMFIVDHPLLRCLGAVFDGLARIKAIEDLFNRAAGPEALGDPDLNANCRLS